MAVIQREFTYLWYYFSVQFEQIFKYWLLGMLIGSGISVFLNNSIHEVMRSLNSKLEKYIIIIGKTISRHMNFGFDKREREQEASKLQFLFSTFSLNTIVFVVLYLQKRQGFRFSLFWAVP